MRYLINLFFFYPARTMFFVPYSAIVPFGTLRASTVRMSYATYKTVEVSTVRSSMTPCLFYDDPAERDALKALITDMDCEPICTSDSEEALRLIRLGRCRLLFASIHLDVDDPYEFLSRALRCDPGIQVEVF
jgi:hypothetical protein